MSKHTLYLCYFGLHEPLVQTQVLPYLREIQRGGIKVSLLTFETKLNQNWTREDLRIERGKLADQGINWHFLPYHKRPSAPATAFDVLNGARFAINLSRKEKIDVFHARAHIPMLMAMLASKITGSKTIFDIRGLMAEEYADAGIWQKNSKPFRFIKFIEQKGIRNASQIVVLTNRMRDYLVKNNLKKNEDIEVIPCCVDFSRIDQSLNDCRKNERFELIYAGSVVGLYLLREMGSFFLALKKQEPDAFFRILTAAPRQIVSSVFEELGIAENDYAVAKVAPGEVPKYLKKAHLGISFRTPTFSQIAASPTKIPEYLACGLPVVVNDGVGDTTEFIRMDKTGVVIKNFSNEDYELALKELSNLRENKDSLSAKCQESAKTRFDLFNVGGEKYRQVYQRIFEEN